MTSLTLHVLDTASGVPAAGVAVRLYRVADTRMHVASDETNKDGRLANPIAQGRDLQPGTYELEFDVGEYFRGRGAALSDPVFLETVVVRFGIADEPHYHVPLLVSPWSYSTYRGS